jgi:hypothetical protein
VRLDAEVRQANQDRNDEFWMMCAGSIRRAGALCDELDLRLKEAIDVLKQRRSF